MAPSSFLALAGLLALAASPATAFWRLPCTAPVVIERADPIINPGVASPHLHTIMGGNGFGFNMDYAQTQASQCSTCTVQKDLSNYWTPNLWYAHENGSFTSVPQVGGVLVYYLQRPGDGEKLTAFPAGFRMVAGDPMKRSFTDDFASRAINYACLNFNGPATPETNGFPTNKCPSGLRAQVFFPSCWDGKNLDSPDHKSHMSYPQNDHAYGKCPPTHPIHFVSLFYEVTFSVDKFDNMWYGNKQPFVWSMGDPTGYGLHGDFVNGWDVDHLQKAINECTNNSGRVEDCPVFKLTPDNIAQGCRIPPSIDEETSGTLDALPGCNPIQPGPGRAVSKSDGCKVSNVIGKPQAYFTDLTQTKKWAYAGCGTDSIYNRQFTGASTSGNGMTVETCVDFCSGKGFSVAGTEYGRECYCANSIPKSAAPVEGYVGNCMMKCAGDPGEYCGGGGTISLYQKCGATCQNPQYGVVGNSTSPAATQVLPVTPDTSPAAGGNGAASPAAPTSPASSPSATKPVVSSSAAANAPPASSVAASSSAAFTPSVPASTLTTNIKLPQGWKAAGCYVDPLQPRLFSHSAPFSGNSVSSFKCVAHCDSQGYPFAGTENGGQCFCSKGLAQNAELKDNKECSTPCKGAPAESCGGPARLSVYTKQSSSSRRHRKMHLHKHRRSYDVLLS